MEQETLFTASKWEILKLLSEQPLSPIELAARSGTSVANVSQQLRLLEMAGLVKSERVPNRDKGQPRILYSLAGNHSFLIATANDFVEKKHVPLSAYNKIILKIWFSQRQELHYTLEKAFWSIEHYLPKIDAIAIDESSREPSFLVLSRDKELGKRLSAVSITDPAGATRSVSFTTLHSDKPGNLPQSLYVLYDPGTIIPALFKEEGVKRK